MAGCSSNDTQVPERSLWIFLVLVCLLSWPLWVVSGVLPRAGAGVYDAHWLVAQIGVMGPALAALFVSGSLSRELRWNSLRLLPVVLVPLVVPGTLVARAAPPKVAMMPSLPAIVTVAVATLVVLFFSPLNRRLLGPATGTPQTRPAGGVVMLSMTLLPALFLLAWALAGVRKGHFEIGALPGEPLSSAWIVLVVFAHNLLLGGSLGEEIGWRGVLLPALLRRMSPLGASLVLGVVWGLWHLPIDLVAGFGVTGPSAILARIVFVLPVAVLFTWFYLRSNGSLLVAILLHTSINVMGDLGFSGYEETSMMFGLLIGASALVLAVFSPMLHSTSAQVA
ncbi:MAG: family intrarane metalloprotease [Acidobacteria bacterium]|nr:family intrarane metalloprotease [Acidobacteriota bacterium]